MRPDWRPIAAVLAELDARGEPTPPCAYIYDLDALRSHAAHLRAGLPPGVELYYAIKANSERPILAALADLVHGFEISSGGELDWVRADFPRLPLIMSGPGKLDEELDAALAAGAVLHLESLWELERLAGLARSRGRRARVFLRINLPLGEAANTTLVMGGRPTPFGLAVDELELALERLAAMPELQFEGFHFHLLSHQRDAHAHLALLRRYLAQVRAWQARYGLAVACINVGGGLGVNYVEPQQPFDWQAFSAGLSDWLATEGTRPVLRFELGRYLSAFCGFYATPVLDLKTRYGRHYAVVRGGTQHFRTPAAQGHSHPFRRFPGASALADQAGPELADAAVTVVGQLCTPKDVLASEVPIARLKVGDWLVFSHAGAYAWHISHHDFLRHPHPEQRYLPAGHSAGLPPSLEPQQ
ncbi:MAG: type III PLP-dependent enzyme [Gammaproteobacteria bacterium]|nr:type III PLP-dependent enzyme [Gammaproteobacteria bacterium]